jgi:hypothetical protein
MGCLIVVLVLAGFVTLPSIWGPLIFWSLAAVLGYQKASNQRQAKQVEGQAKQLEEQRKQNRELIKAVNPRAYQELIAKEAREEEEARRDANRGRVYKGLAAVVLIVAIGISVVANHHSEPSYPSTSTTSESNSAGDTGGRLDSPAELRKFVSGFLVALRNGDKGESIKYLAPVLEEYFGNKNVSREVAVDLEVPRCQIDSSAMTVTCLRTGEYVVEGAVGAKTLSADVVLANDNTREIKSVSLGSPYEMAASTGTPVTGNPTPISRMASVQTPAPTMQTPAPTVQTPVPVASAQKVSSLPSPLKGYPGDRPRKDGIGIATEVLLGQTPVASKLNDLKSALEAIARKDKKAVSVLIDQGKVAIWPEHTYCFDAWTDLSDQPKLFRRVYTEDASEVVWIPAPVVEGPALVSDSNVPKADRVDGGDSEEPKGSQKAKKQSTSATSFNPFGRNLLDPSCAAALVDCEGQGLAYYSKVQNVVSEDDPAEQARLYLNSEEAVLVKKYGAKGADVYEDGFYRTVNDIFKNDLGPQPRADWFDGGIKEIGDPIIASMNDPRSYKFDRFTTEVTQYEKTWCWKVDYYFRGKNAFGALILNHVFAYFRKGGLIAIKEAND